MILIIGKIWSYKKYAGSAPDIRHFKFLQACHRDGSIDNVKAAHKPELIL